ncbi:hypothetical protein FF1_038470 [Malus domestica]
MKSRKNTKVADEVSARIKSSTWVLESREAFLLEDLDLRMILSSTHITVIRTLVPHLSQSVVIPHLMAMSLVLFEPGLIGFGFTLITDLLFRTASVVSTMASELNHLKEWHRVCVNDVVALVIVVEGEAEDEGLSERRRMREMWPLNSADMAALKSEECLME